MLSPTGSKNTVFTGPLTIAEATGLTAEFRGDVTVTDQLSGCHLLIGGRLDAGTALVFGGSLRAEGQASVGTLGSPDGTPTRLTLLTAAGPAGKLAKALTVLTEENAAIEEMRKRIAMLEEDASQFDHSEREEMTLAMFDMPEHETAIERLKQLTSLAQERFGTTETDSGTSLSIAQILHAGVTVAFEGTDAVWTCQEDLVGPVRISLNDESSMTAESESGEIRNLEADADDVQKTHSANPGADPATGKNAEARRVLKRVSACA